MACGQQILRLYEGSIALSSAPLLLGSDLGLQLCCIGLDPLLLNILHDIPLAA